MNNEELKKELMMANAEISRKDKELYKYKELYKSTAFEVYLYIAMLGVVIIMLILK